MSWTFMFILIFLYNWLYPLGYFILLIPKLFERECDFKLFSPWLFYIMLPFLYRTRRSLKKIFVKSIENQVSFCKWLLCFLFYKFTKKFRKPLFLGCLIFDNCPVSFVQFVCCAIVICDKWSWCMIKKKRTIDLIPSQIWR